MKMKCEYCGGWLQDSDTTCPHCGGTNNNLNRFTVTTPKTIDELKQWYKERNLPPSEITRFFIGEDYKGAKAFGIYRDSNSGNFVVYKNKADGSRAIRYEGDDEAYAVNEIYLKLKSEILNQKSYTTNRSTVSHAPKRSSGLSNYSMFEIIVYVILFLVICVIAPPIGLIMIAAPAISVYENLTGKLSGRFGDKLSFLPKIDKDSIKYKIIKRGIFWGFLIIILAIIFIAGSPKYYNYNGRVFCDYNGKYYEYNNNDYTPIAFYDLPAPLYENKSAYTFSSSDVDWSSSYSFTDSHYYEDYYSSSYSSGSNGDSYSNWDSDSDWDSGYDWDSGSDWDSGYTDWGSDW